MIHNHVPPNKSFHLVTKRRDEEEEPGSLPYVEKKRSLWTDGEELLLAETYIQVSEDPKKGADQQRDTFWYKVMDVYNKEAKRLKYPNRSKNMITGKWTPMNRDVEKFNTIVCETALMSGENDKISLERFATYSKEVNEEVVEMHVADKKIADSWFTATYLCSKEVEMVVLENIFVRKDEAQGSAFADLSIVGANNQIFATDVVNAGTIAVLKDDAEGNENVESTTSEMSI
ncbi:hypothetical protein Tco_0822949 [Tanacetum coccineum]|uniref:Uncharacterized protein n=1 Tax=Tanacetum coccineum TaxID=301880 RepID=A0ABQ5AGI9_9ASTR